MTATAHIYNHKTGQREIRELTADEQAAIDALAIEVETQRQANLVNERRAAFQIEADPLFFAWQRGESTEQAWLDKVAEIRARYPYTDET